MMNRNPLIKHYPRNRDIALIGALVLCIGLSRFAANVEITSEQPEVKLLPITVEDIPVTQQGRRRPPPPKPAVPIPSEDEDIPEDMTISPMQWDFFAQSGEDGGNGASDNPLAGGSIIQPRPIAWVIPEYIEDESKKGHRGEIKLSIEIDPSGKVVEVTVIDNQTGSALLAQAAIRAARASRFIPAMKSGKPTSFWLTQTYRFDKSD